MKKKKIICLTISFICLTGSISQSIERVKEKKQERAGVSDKTERQHKKVQAEIDQKHFPEDYAYVDVTKPPYNADNTGKTDCTDAINKALTNNGSTVFFENDSRKRTYTVGGKIYPVGHRGPVIYFPAGTYLVSDRIMPSYLHDRDYSACRVWIQGAGIDKTIIKLKDKAAKYQNKEKPRAIVRTGNDGSGGHLANSAYNNHLADFTIINGKNNPGAIGLWYDVANTGVAENIKIVSEGPGWAGITCDKVAGTGLVKKTEIIGFDYGVNYNYPDDVNNIVFEYLKVSGQKIAGFRSRTKMSIIRKLTSIQNRDIPAILLDSHHAMMILIDSQIIGEKQFSRAIEINGGTPVYLRDIRIKNYKTAVKHNSSINRDIVDTEYITDYYSTSNESELLEDRYSTIKLPVRETPSYHVNDMTLWKNAKEFGAIPNDGKEDSGAIEKAINSMPEGGILYFEYGLYRVSRDLNIDTKARKIDFCGARFEKSRIFFNINNINNRANEIIFNNLHSRTGFHQNSSGTLVIKNKFPQTKITSSTESKGDIILENLGPFPGISIQGGNKLWAHSINQEIGRASYDNCQAWLFGVNHEMKGRGKKKNGWQFIHYLKPRTEALNYSVIESYNIQDGIAFDFPSYNKGANDYHVYYAENSIFSVVAGGAHREMDMDYYNRKYFDKVVESINPGHTHIGKLYKYVKNGKVIKEFNHIDGEGGIYSAASREGAVEINSERSFFHYNNGETPVKKGEYYDDFEVIKTSSDNKRVETETQNEKIVFYEGFESGKNTNRLTAYKGKGSFLLQGNEKRKKAHFKIQLKPEKEYILSAAIKKNGTFSDRKQDTQIRVMNVVGEEWGHLAQLGVHIKNDGKWHFLKCNFKTGSRLGKVLFQVMNFHSSGKMYVDELKVVEVK